MNMFQKILVLGALTSGWATQATLYTFTWNSGFAGDGAIPDANPSGWSDTRSVPNSFTLGPNDTAEIVDVNVRLNISGGYNGDLYGYLVHSSGFTVLLNRIGRTGTDPFGNSGAGMSVTLDDQVGTDIHGASFTTLSGTYNPDGRNIDPASSTATFDSSTRQNDGNPLAVFNGMDANGSWTLFLSDMAGGDTSTLVSWGLDIEVVPEPVGWALIGFAAVFGLVTASRWFLRKTTWIRGCQGE